MLSHSRRNRQLLRLGILLGALWPATNSIAIAEYGAPRLVVAGGDTVDGYQLTSLTSDLSLNDNGEIAFRAMFADGEGVFTLDRLVAKSDDVINGRTLLTTTNPVINNDGTVVFKSVYSDAPGSGIYTQHGAVFEPGDVIDGFPITNTGPAFINNAGEIFVEGRNDDAHAVLTSEAVVVSTEQLIDGTPWIHAATVKANDTGQIVFMGYKEGEGTNTLFSPSEILAETGDIIGGMRIGRIDHSFDINNRGDIVFSAEVDTGSGVFTLNDMLVGPGSVIERKRITYVGEPAINDSGTVVFTAGGIFSLDEEIIGLGDVVDGWQVFEFLGIDINNRGEIAAWATLYDGERVNTGIVLIPVPEPSSFALALVGLGIGAGCVARRNRSSVRMTTGLAVHRRLPKRPAGF